MKKLMTFGSCLFFSSTLFAIEVEQRDLSNNTATPTTPTSVQSTQFWELHQQLQQLQTLVRQLRGQIEEQNNQIEQLNQELKNRYTDLDQRLELLNQKIDSDTENENTDENNATPQISPPTAPPTNSATNTAQSIIETPQITADEAAYNAAYEAYKQGGAIKAIIPMENFTKNYPRSPYISHAYYWLGEFYLSITPPKYHQAKDHFNIVAGNYPQSNKAAAALYRLIEIAQNIDKDLPKAREYYLKLIQKYPKTKEAELAKTTMKL